MLENVKRYLRLFCMLLKCSLMNSLEYKLNFFMGGLFEITWLLMNVLFFQVIFMNTSSIGGWNSNEVLLLVFFCGLCDGVITFFVNSGCGDIPGMVNQGTLDFILLKPVNTRFYLSLRRQSIPQVYNIVFNIAAIIYITVVSGISPSFQRVAVSLVLALNGIFINYIILFTLMTLSFWVVKMDVVFSMTQEIFTIGNKPVSIYPRLVQKLFTYVIPVAAAFSYPVMYYAGKLDSVYICSPFAVSLCFFIISHIVLKVGLKRYSSASS